MKKHGSRMTEKREGERGRGREGERGGVERNPKEELKDNNDRRD